MFILPLSEKTAILGFVVYPAVVVTTKRPVDVEVYVTEIVRVVKSWVETLRGGENGSGNEW